MKPTEETGGNPREINVTQLIEDRKAKGFIINLLAWTFCLMILEAFDVAAASYAAPVLIKQWHVEAKTFGTIFGAGLFGLMVGGFIFGYLGDLIGRKKALLIGTLEFSLFTFASIWANDVPTLLYLRFLACIGLGGTVPLSIVLVNEYAPMRARGKYVSYMFIGFPFGMSVGGMAAAWLVPHYGWQSIFIVGGIVPLFMSIGLYFKLPESLKFLVVKNKARSEIAKLVSALEPGIVIGRDTRFIVEDVEKNQNFSPKLLFAGALLFVTPLIWAFYIVNSASVYFLNSWMPQLHVASGFSLQNASIATSLYHLAGMMCGLAAGWLFDKRGILACAIFPVCGCLVVSLLGFPKSFTLTIVNVFFAGFFVVGTQMVLTVTTPTFYPIAYRSSANGIAMAIAKIGSISGPVIGGMLMSAKLPLKELYFLNSAILAFGAIMLFILGLLYERHFAVTEKAAAKRAFAH